MMLSPQTKQFEMEDTWHKEALPASELSHLPLKIFGMCTGSSVLSELQL